MSDYNILELIDRARPNLGRGSRQAAEHILANLASIADISLAELGRLAQVSERPVLRFCATIGCSGFRKFKIRVVQSLALGAAAAHSVLVGGDDPETVATKIFDYTITSLDWARKKLDFAAIGRAVDVLSAANRIEFFGFGASGMLRWTHSRSCQCSASPASPIRTHTNNSSRLPYSSWATRWSPFRTPARRAHR